MVLCNLTGDCYKYFGEPVASIFRKTDAISSFKKLIITYHTVKLQEHDNSFQCHENLISHFHILSFS